MKRVMACLAAVCLLLTACGCQRAADPPAPVVPAVEYITPVARENAIDPVSGRAGRPIANGDMPWPETEEETSLGYFLLSAVTNPDLPFSLLCALGEGEITGLFPDGTDLSAVVAEFAYTGAEVRYNGEPAVSGVTVFDFTKSGTLTLVETDGTAHDLTLDVQTLYTGLPAVAVTVNNLSAISSREIFYEADFYVGGGDPRVCGYAAETPNKLTCQVRGRGNSSWGHPKKGYSVNLDTAAPMLDMPSARKWALVSNYEDKSLMRNCVAQYLSDKLGLDARLSVRPVDLWYNGQYWGTYDLCERVSVHEARVPITEQESVSGLAPADVAYIFEFDGHVNEVSDKEKAMWQKIGSHAYFDPITGEVFMQIALAKKWLTIRTPSADQVTAEMADYVWNYVAEACMALVHEDWEEINEYLDVRSFVKWYMVEELMNNTDSSFHSSVIMYRDVGGKLTLGPPWDFDRSSGNCDYWNTEDAVDSLYKSSSAWFKYIFACDEGRAMLKEEWENFSPAAAGVGELIDAFQKQLTLSQKYNFDRWPILYQSVGAEPKNVVRAHTFEDQVKLLRTYLTRRYGSMDRRIQRLK